MRSVGLPLILLIALIVPIGPPSKSTHAQSEIVGGLLVGKALDDFAKRLKEIVADATANGDFLLEKNARLVLGVVRDVNILFGEQLDKAVDKLDRNHQNILATVGRLVDEVQGFKGRMLSLEDFVALDLEHVLGQLPKPLGYGKDSYSFRRLDGYSQRYQEEGVYSFRFVGAAFGPGFRAKILVNGKPVQTLDIRTPRVYVLEFDVPVEVLNGKFRDKTVERGDVEVESFADGKDKPVFTYKDKILLLPKYPIEFELFERQKVQTWSKETYWTAESSTFVARAEEGRPKFGTASVKVPDNCRMLKETVTIRVKPTLEELNDVTYRWMLESLRRQGREVDWATDTNYSDEDRAVSRGFANWLPHDRHLFMKVAYRKPVFEMKDRPSRIGKTVDGRQYLPFGTTLADFSPEYQSFTLNVKWFNGRKEVLTPTRLSRPYVSATLETTSAPRLRVDVSWPGEAANP
jgi:hypothetical protein